MSDFHVAVPCLCCILTWTPITAHQWRAGYLHRALTVRRMANGMSVGFAHDSGALPLSGLPVKRQVFGRTPVVSASMCRSVTRSQTELNRGDFQGCCYPSRVSSNTVISGPAPKRIDGLMVPMPRLT
jgi:hypothetical protein